ncbi:MAG: hypothetical protein IKQ91_03510 [Oscillospiraceae bacterium]|nr:hypothetical protein [Oscillospiraceae bacterium]
MVNIPILGSIPQYHPMPEQRAIRSINLNHTVDDKVYAKLRRCILPEKERSRRFCFYKTPNLFFV